MAKSAGAFLTIGEVAEQLGVAQHILRYWEQRFPQLRPLQRAGNRRYYRPDDVALVHRINHLLNVEGFTVKGAQQALSSKRPTKPVVANESLAPASQLEQGNAVLIARLEAVRGRLEELLQ
jgi:DNA-binding transcriptional MerR regulator